MYLRYYLHDLQYLKQPTPTPPGRGFNFARLWYLRYDLQDNNYL